MSATMNVTAFDAVMRDVYPRPGERIKQWVVDTGREQAWERETCPIVTVPDHRDNTGAECRNCGSSAWIYLSHDCCYVCNDQREATATRPDVVAWLAERAARPPIERDHKKLSDEIAPDLSLTAHPTIDAMMRSR